MKTRRLLTRGLTLALAGSALAPAAFAQDTTLWPRWYVGLGGSVGFLDDSDLGGPVPGKVQYDTGYGATLSLGYHPGLSHGINNLRIEGEVGYRYFGLDALKDGATTTPLSGHTHAWTYMANLYYDFYNESNVTPYIGGGIGGARINLKRNAALDNTGNSDNVFAYQLMAGISYAPESIPLTEWSIGYRFMDLGDPKFGSTPTSIELQDYRSHNIEAGARFRF